MIVGISGKINSGKDTIGNIIQILIDSPHFTNEAVISFLNKPVKYSYINMKFANSLKDIVCILLGCTKEQLENREFKEKELGEEWWYYDTGDKHTYKELTPYTKGEYDTNVYMQGHLIKPTPRLLLQQQGTECGRNILHPNVWINSLMSKYNLTNYKPRVRIVSELEIKGDLPILNQYPNWIITDMRFPNELKAIKDREGISIRVNRERWIDIKYLSDTTTFPIDLKTSNYDEEIIHRNIQHYENGRYYYNNNANVIIEELVTHFRKIEVEHESETVLDNAEFDVTIDNNGTLSDLVDKCKEVIKEFELK